MRGVPVRKGKGWCRVRTESKKKKGTFVVHVYHCENATWQGEVVWAEQNRTQKFRSALELLKLMDSALEEPEKQEEQEEQKDGFAR